MKPFVMLPIYEQHYAVFQFIHASLLKSLFSINTIYQHCFGDHRNKCKHTTFQWLSKAGGLPRIPGYEVNHLKTSVLITLLCIVK